MQCTFMHVCNKQQLDSRVCTLFFPTTALIGLMSPLSMQTLHTIFASMCVFFPRGYYSTNSFFQAHSLFLTHATHTHTHTKSHCYRPIFFVLLANLHRINNTVATVIAPVVISYLCLYFIRNPFVHKIG